MRLCLLRRRVLFALLTVLATAAVRAGQVEVPVVGDVSPGASAGAVGSSLGALAPLSMTVSPSLGAPSFAAPLTGAPMAVLPAASARPASAAPLPSLPKSTLGPRAAAAVPGSPNAGPKAGAVDAAPAENGRDAAPAPSGAPESDADAGRVLFDRSGVTKSGSVGLGSVDAPEPAARLLGAPAAADGAFAVAERLAALADRADAVRRSMVYDVLLGRHDPDGKVRGRFDWSLGRHPVDALQVGWIEEAVAKRDKTALADPEYDRLRREVARIDAEMDRLIARRDSSLSLIRDVAAARDRRRAVLEAARASGERDINIYVSHQVANGVLGTAKLIANGLTAADPGVKVTIYVLDRQSDGGLFDDADPRIKIVDMSQADLLGQKLHLRARVHVNVSGGVEIERKGDAVFTVNPQPNAQGERRSGDYYRGFSNNNLRDPYGTLYFDRGRYRRRLESDAWSDAAMVSHRRSWLEETLAGPARRTLTEAARAEGWDPAKAAWTWGYTQDTARFLAEMKSLAQALRGGAERAVPFADGGRQVLVHFVPGGYLTEPLEARALVAMGIAVVDAATGQRFAPAGGARAPVTVVLHPRIANRALTTLQSQLSGTLEVRDGVRTGLPAFMTGSGSWLEAVSAGSIVLHDNYDTNRNAKKNILISTLVRFYALERPDWTAARVQQEARDRVGDYLLGESGHDALYADLRGWTLRSRRYAEAQFHFDQVDDILAAARAGAGGVAKPAGFDLGPGKTIVPDLLAADVYSPRIMDAAREHGLVFDATPATLKRMKPGAQYNYIIAENPDGTVAMTVGRMDPRNDKETAVKHVALAEGRPVLFSGVIRIDGAAGRPVLDFNSGSYSGVGLDPRWDPTPENARALSAYAQALLGTPVDILDHFQNRLIDLRGPGPLRSIVRRGASRGEGWEVDGRPVKRLSAGGFKEVLLHPSDPNVVIKLFSVTNAGDSVGSLSEKRLEMRNLAPLLAIGRAPRVVEQGGVVLETPATKGKMNAGYIVQERVVGRELGEMLKDPDPAVRARAAAEARALFDDLVAARIKLDDEVNMRENISIGRAGGGGPVKAWVLDAGEASVVAKQSLVDRTLGRPDPLRAYYDRVLSALLRR